MSLMVYLVRCLYTNVWEFNGHLRNAYTFEIAAYALQVFDCNETRKTFLKEARERHGQNFHFEDLFCGFWKKYTIYTYKCIG